MDVDVDVDVDVVKAEECTVREDYFPGISVSKLR
jgi:hypothetical protein